MTTDMGVAGDLDREISRPEGFGRPHRVDGLRAGRWGKPGGYPGGICKLSSSPVSDPTWWWVPYRGPQWRTIWPATPTWRG